MSAFYVPFGTPFASRDTYLINMDRSYKGTPAIRDVRMLRYCPKHGVNTGTLKNLRSGNRGRKIHGWMNRCRLKGRFGEALNAVLMAAPYNSRLRRRAITDLLPELLGHHSQAVIDTGLQNPGFKPSLQAPA